MASFNASFLSGIDGLMHLYYGSRKKALLNDHPSYIVEIGAGAGANFRYYRSGTKVLAVEPSKAMHKPLLKKAGHYNINLEIRDIKAEKMDIDDESTDMVVSSLVLCSVDEPASVLSEVYRVLKPGGKFVFVEHIGAKKGSALRYIQNAIHKPWHNLFEGCHTNRDTESVLQQVGFSILKSDNFKLISPLIPVIPHIHGFAVK